MTSRRTFGKIAKKLGLEKQFSQGQVLFDEPKNVELVPNKTRMNISRRVQNEINVDWKEHKAEHPKDFNGCVGSIISIFESPEETLNIEFHKGRFSQFCTTAETRKTRLNIRSFPLDEGTCLPISFGGIALTKDNYIVFARRGQTAFDAGKITLHPGGYFNPETDWFLAHGPNGVIRTYSIVITVLRGLFEELGIPLTCLKITYLGLVYSKQESRQPSLICRIDLPLTAEEIRERISFDEESKEVFFVKNDINSVITFLLSRKEDIAIHDAWKLFYLLTKGTKHN